MRQNLARYYGDRARVWLEQLPGRLEQITSRWDLELEGAFPKLSINYVAAATQRATGRPVALKMSPSLEEIRREHTTLEAFEPGRTCGALALDEELAALLLERVTPGQDLSTLPEDEAIRQAGLLMGGLHRPWTEREDVDLPQLRDWFEGMARLRDAHDGRPGPLPPGLFGRAEGLAAELLEERAPQVLLHGDLHHHNILWGRARGWIAIDPKGILGPRAFEACALLRNPPGFAERAGALEVLDRRTRVLAEACELDRPRLLAWGLAEAMLSASWGMEGAPEAWASGVAMARLYEQLLLDSSAR